MRGHFQLIKARSNEHPTRQAFLQTPSPEYKIPGGGRVCNIIKELDEAITARLDELLRDAGEGPWFLTSDGATSKGEGLLTVDCRNAHGECYYLTLVNGDWRKQDAAFLRQQSKAADLASQKPCACLLWRIVESLKSFILASGSDCANCARDVGRKQLLAPGRRRLFGLGPLRF